MPDKNPQASHDQDREQAVQALRTFEHILEIMPDDPGTLEAVIMAAEQCGEVEKALGHRMRLAELMLEQGDLDGAQPHLDILRAAQDPRARSWIAAHDMNARGAAGTLTGEPEVILGEPVKTPHFAVDISAEIDLAWKIMEQELITQEEYASLVRDLTEMSAGKQTATVSLLHALEGSHHKGLENILAWMAQAARTPYISLACYAMRQELRKILPDDFIVHHGALAFDTMGRELLVAMLNPFNEGLRALVQKTAGRTCHFYLARASEFEEAHKRLRDLAEEP